MKRFSILVLIMFIELLPIKIKASETTIQIYYEDNAQFELVGPEGQRIMIDVYDPVRLTGPPSNEDLLLTTHFHWDHLHTAFFNAFPGRRLSSPGVMREGKLQIRGIMSSHYSIPEHPIAKEHQNVIYVITWHGLRVVHFGDTQQLQLTSEQLRAIGEVDIAIVPLMVDPMGYIDPTGFGILTQIKTKLIIPAHMNEAAGKHASTLWRGYRTEEKMIIIGCDDLHGETKLLLMGKNTQLFHAWPSWPPSATFLPSSPKTTKGKKVTCREYIS